MLRIELPFPGKAVIAQVMINNTALAHELYLLVSFASVFSDLTEATKFSRVNYIVLLLPDMILLLSTQPMLV